jgi:small subunit ribosomal protein S4
MIRKKSKYQKPKKAFETSRIKEENQIKDKYGLKNKKEIWKAIAKIAYFRQRAKSLITADPEEQILFLNKLKNLGLKTETIADVLALEVEDILQRRLATVVVAKTLATTPRQARQMIVHKKVLINNFAIDSPSYLVPINEENLISVRKITKKPKPEIEKPADEKQADAQPAKPDDANPTVQPIEAKPTPKPESSTQPGKPPDNKESQPEKTSDNAGEQK